jgi:hypothetical protein
VAAIRIKTSSGELVIERGHFALATGKDLVAQDIAARLKTFRGEWFLDESIGVPYWTEVLGKKRPNLGAIERRLRAEILDVPGVTGILTFTLSLDAAARALSGRFTAATEFGAVEGTI